MTPEPSSSEIRPRRLYGWRCGLGVALAVTLAVGLAWHFGFLSTGSDSVSSETRDQEPFRGAAWFRDVTQSSGVQASSRSGLDVNPYSILAMMGSGVALLDYDGDGLLDIFVAGGGTFDGPAGKKLVGQPCKLYRNLGGWRFQDVTREAGLDLAWWYTQGVAVADYDRDGWPDLLVTGYGRIGLFHNESDGRGGRRFVEVTKKVGLSDPWWATSAGWADLDGDGYPDLYVCHYVDWSFDNDPICSGLVPGIVRDACPPQEFKAQRHTLFHNEKGKGFRDVSQEHGFKAVQRGLGIVLVDVNDDGQPDFYVTNDGGNNFLWMNRSGKFVEVGERAGVAVDDNGHYNGSMGTDAADVDGRGRPWLWVTNYQGQMHSLYANLGNGLFQYRSRKLGLGALGTQLVGFGTGFFDGDNDGWEDLIVVNGHVIHHPALGSTFAQRPLLLRNLARDDERILRSAPRQGGPFFQEPIVARGLAIGDLDNDGFPDLVVTQLNGPAIVLRNEAGSVDGGRWLGVKLVGKDHRDVVGSTITLETDERRLTRFAKGGGSYMSASDSRILFGLGKSARPGRMTVRWSWGPTQTWEGLQEGSYWELHEGQAEPRRLTNVGSKSSKP